MIIKNAHLQLALVLSMFTLGQLACNNSKGELLEGEQTDEAQSDGTPNRDNRSIQSGDAAFIKIFPDGDLIPTRAETATVTVTTPAASAEAAPSASAVPSADASESQASAPVASAPVPAEDTAAPAAEAQAPAPQTAPVETSTPAAEPIVTTEPAPAPAVVQEPTPAPAPAVIQEPTPAPAPVVIEQPAPAPVVVQQPAPAPVVVQQPAPAPAPADEPAAADKDMDDPTRPVLSVNEATASQLITIQPKENKATVTIGKHSDFTDGPYMVFAKWTDDSKKVKVQVSGNNSDKDCKIDESATQGEWKTLGVFYLTKNAKVVITNKKNSSFAVKNELLLKPVIAEHLTKPSKFKCLDGQIDGQGLVGYQ